MRIHQDQNGFIWLAFGSGVRRYDGSGYHSYRHIPFDTTSINLFEEHEGKFLHYRNVSDCRAR